MRKKRNENKICYGTIKKNVKIILNKIWLEKTLPKKENLMFFFILDFTLLIKLKGLSTKVCN